MEKHSFDLEQSLEIWRNRLRADGVAPDVIEELEGHLVESAESLQAEGLSAEESFRVAVGRLGDPSALAADPPQPQPKRKPSNKGAYALLAVGACLLVGSVLVAIASAYLTPKKYLGSTTLQVSPNASNISDYQQFNQTQFAIIESRATLEPVVEDLRLSQVWNESEENALKRLKKSLHVESVSGTNLIRIEVIDHDPHLVPEMANAIAEMYQSRASESTIVQIHEKAGFNPRHLRRVTPWLGSTVVALIGLASAAAGLLMLFFRKGTA